MSLQVPPLTQGLDSHSLLLTSQLVPLQPGAQSHVYLGGWARCRSATAWGLGSPGGDQRRPRAQTGSCTHTGMPPVQSQEAPPVPNMDPEPGGVCARTLGHPGPLRGAGLGSTLPGSACPPRTVPVQTVLANPVDTGAAVALIDLGQAGGVVVTLGATAGEGIDAILTGTTVTAGAAATLINVDVAQAACGQVGRAGGSAPHVAPRSPLPTPLAWHCPHP